MTILNDLFAKEGLIQIIRKIEELYPGQHKNHLGYKKAILAMAKLTPISTGITLSLKWVEDEFENEKTLYVDVSGRNKDSEFNLALDFTPWAEWLGAVIPEEVLSNFERLDIVAHCIYEMTFHGYDEASIQETFKEIKERVEELASGDFSVDDDEDDSFTWDDEEGWAPG